MGEKRKNIFVNLHGNRDGLSEKLRNLLDYLETSVPTDEFTKSLERKVEEVKSNDEWRDNFVTLEQKIELEVKVASERACEEGHAKGLADECEKTEERIRELMKKL